MECAEGTHVVYRCYDSADRLLYIGCTQDFVARMQVHECSPHNPASFELMRRLDRVECEEYPDRATARQAEREAIMAEAPMLNIHHNLGRGMRDLPPVERPHVPEEQMEMLRAYLNGEWGMDFGVSA